MYNQPMYGIWSHDREAWLVCGDGRVFATPSVFVARAQLKYGPVGRGFTKAAVYEISDEGGPKGQPLSQARFE